MNCYFGLSFIKLITFFVSAFLVLASAKSVNAKDGGEAPKDSVRIQMLEVTETQNFMRNANDIFLLGGVELEELLLRIDEKYFKEGRNILIAFQLVQHMMINAVTIFFEGVLASQISPKAFRASPNNTNFLFCFLALPDSVSPVRHNIFIWVAGKGKPIELTLGYLNPKHIYTYRIESEGVTNSSIYNLNRAGYKILKDCINQYYKPMLKEYQQQRTNDSLTIAQDIKSQGFFRPRNLAIVSITATSLVSAISFYRADTEYKRYLSIGKFEPGDDTFKDYKCYNRQGQIALGVAGGIALYYGIIRHFFQNDSKFENNKRLESTSTKYVCPDTLRTP